MKIKKQIFMVFIFLLPTFSNAADSSFKKNTQILFPMILPEKENPMFKKDAINSIGFYIAQGTGSGTLFKLIDPLIWDFYSMTLFMVQYSQPTTIFRLPARQSLYFVQNLAYGHEAGLSFSAIGLSWDVSLYDHNGWYFGLGIGPYMRDSRDRWVESRLVFGEKFFIGTKVSDDWRMEFFTQHFSNGNFTTVNEGFNFVGFSGIYSF
jgi:hypothetical protein